MAAVLGIEDWNSEVARGIIEPVLAAVLPAIRARWEWERDDRAFVKRVRAEALREAADEADRVFSKAYLLAPWLRSRADAEEAP